MIVFLNEESDIEGGEAGSIGSLRLFNRDGSVDVDIAPRIGRAVLFKSELVEH